MKNPENTNPEHEPAIELESVSVAIGKTLILDDINLKIPQHSISGILGPNGAGKSTLIALVIGLGKHTHGKVTVLGHNVPTKNDSFRSQIGVVLQETSLYEELTIAENLLFYASLYNVHNPKQRIEEVLSLLGLSDRSSDLIRILSGGLKRRCAIARALLHNPKLLVVDEPTLGVDVETRHTIWSHLRSLPTQGHTVLIASNYLDEAQAICDTVSVLNKGKLIVTDTPQALIAKTGHSLDIDCVPQSAEKIASELLKTGSVVRTEITPSGITVFIQGETIPDTIINNVLKTAPINGFRFRPADLAEMFQALQLTNSGESTKEGTPDIRNKSFLAKHPILITFLTVIILGGLLFLEVWFSQPQ